MRGKQKTELLVVVVRYFYGENVLLYSVWYIVLIQSLAGRILLSGLDFKLTGTNNFSIMKGVCHRGLK